jgi:hypothetical protein
MVFFSDFATQAAECRLGDITFPHFEIDEDFVSVRCEVARAGNTFAELEAELREVSPSYKRPALLERFIRAEEPLKSEKPNKDYEAFSA